jgi:DNA-binding NarL/FixJ family response regulator
MCKSTRTQQALMRQLDEGREVEDISSNLGSSVLAVKQQIARIRRRVQAGHVEPSPLPIEKAAPTISGLP